MSLASSKTPTAHSATPAACRVPGTQIPCYVFESNRDLARHVAQMIASIIRERNAFGQKAVFGLPTGSTPLGVYRELIRMHREEGLDFSNVITFNLDEYHGLQPDQLQSYHRWMFENFFDHVDIRVRISTCPTARFPPKTWKIIAGVTKIRSSAPAASTCNC